MNKKQGSDHGSDHGSDGTMVTMSDDMEEPSRVGTRTALIRSSFYRQMVLVFLILVVAAISFCGGVIFSDQKKEPEVMTRIVVVERPPQEEQQVIVQQNAVQPVVKQQSAAKALPSSVVVTHALVTEVCSDEDKTACREICSGAHECCGFGAHTTCLHEEYEGCSTYAACHVLLQEEVPPAPEDLTEWCSGSDVTACEDACAPVACCYDDRTESCRTDNFLQCLDYAACQNLRPNARVNVAPSNLDEICNPLTQPNLDACDNVCQAEAGCCWSQNILGNCLANDWISCLTYAPCGALLIEGSPEEPLPTPPDDLEQICSLQELVLGDSTACEDACAPASCCADEDIQGGGNCFLQDPIGCLGYDKCGLLWLLQRGDDLPKPPADLAQTCSLPSLLQDPQPCLDACEIAQCCVDRDFRQNCLLGGNALRCREYAPCALGAVFGRRLTEPPAEQLRAACGIQAIANPANRQTCRDLCEPASCCTARGSENCIRSNVDMCARWGSLGCWFV